jgi:hypothetical protein
LLLSILPFTTDVPSKDPRNKGCACWTAKARQIGPRAISPSASALNRYSEKRGAFSDGRRTVME